MSINSNSAQQTVTESLRAIGLLFEPGDVIEIRALDVGRSKNRSGSTSSGYFDFESRDAITSAIREVDGRSEGVYMVFNRLNPALLARSNNRLTTRPKRTTSDADIIEWRWLFIDIDPVRPAGIPATDAEHQAALERTAEIREFLRQRGWSEPIHADSGNGGHLLYRLPRLDLNQAAYLVKCCLRALSARFSDQNIKLDESTGNAARMCKLYGTVAKKGDPTKDRPHRRSSIIGTPERIEQVRSEVLEALASEAQAELPLAHSDRRGNKPHPNFDLDQWLARTGIEIVKGPDPYRSGARWTLRSCPFNPDHKRPVLIRLSGGALVYKCLHKSCAANDWKAFRNLFSDRPSPLGAVPQGTTAVAPDEITDISQLPSVWNLKAQIDWCVPDMIARGSVTLICSESGTGKTWFGYYLGGCIANGTPVLGREVLQSKVLYLDGENPLYAVKQRLKSLNIRETDDLSVWGGWNLSPPRGPEDQSLIKFTRLYKPLLIFDSLIEFHPGSEQSSTETRAYMRYFRNLANLDATVIVLHHTGKSETARIYRGSSDIKAAVDTAYLLERVGEESNRISKLSLKCFKGRLVPGQNFAFEFREGVGFVACDLPAPSKTVESVINDILEAHPRSNQQTVIRLGRDRGCGKGQLEHSLRTGLWHREDGPNNSILYSPPERADIHQEDGK